MRHSSSSATAGLLLLLLPGRDALSTAPLAIDRRTIPFPRRLLRQFFQDSPQPGTRIDSPPFSVSGSRWIVSLYPCGASADPTYSGRSAIYLRWLQPDDRVSAATEVDASFSLQMCTAEGEALGTRFACGMTFCGAIEAGESVGRCEDWGAHLFSTNELLYEMNENDSELSVDLNLTIWDRRACASNAALKALGEQARRVPRGALRVGEVVVALPYAGSDGGGSSDSYRPIAGVEYRIMRLESADGRDVRFNVDASDAQAAEATIAYIRPTGPAARALVADSNLIWPVGVRVSSLPPLASRIGFRALPARLAYTARTRSRSLLLFIILGASPLWGGFFLSQLGSAYVIPSRSMEGTLLTVRELCKHAPHTHARTRARTRTHIALLALYPPCIQTISSERIPHRRLRATW